MEIRVLWSDTSLRQLQGTKWHHAMKNSMNIDTWSLDMTK